MKKIIAITIALSAPFVQGQAGPSVSLSISQQSSGQILVAWPTSPPNFRLEERTSLSAESTWLPSALAPTESNGRYEVLVNPTVNSQYFRLSQVLTGDVPDAAYLDTNGDGIDGDVAKAIFVAPPPLGNDANPGTMDQPVSSIETHRQAGRAV